MRIPVKATVNNVAIWRDDKGRIRYNVALVLDNGGALSFTATNADAPEWMLWVGQKIELMAGRIVKVDPAFKAAPLD
jgi:hypothetical protein